MTKLKVLWRRFMFWLYYEQDGTPRRKYTPVDD